MAYIHKVQYYETDRMDVTHHSNYIRFMEEARIDFLARLGFGYDKMEAAGVVSPVTSISCDFKKPTTYPDEIEVEVCVKAASAASVTLGYDMKCRGETVFTAESSHCFLKNGKIISLKREMPELFARLAETAKDE
ncbi:MAG: acyl-CoA thioesterase [Clostridia bacterium]|nr:acyl-CoA thioesterase [Clostridia bacterium]